MTGEPRQATVELEHRYHRGAHRGARRGCGAPRPSAVGSPPRTSSGSPPSCGLPRAHVYGAASFYADLGFEPRERHAPSASATAPPASPPPAAPTRGASARSWPASPARPGASASTASATATPLPPRSTGRRRYAGADLVDQLAGRAPAPRPADPVRGRGCRPRSCSHGCSGRARPPGASTSRCCVDPDGAHRGPGARSSAPASAAEAEPASWPHASGSLLREAGPASEAGDRKRRRGRPRLLRRPAADGTRPPRRPRGRRARGARLRCAAVATSTCARSTRPRATRSGPRCSRRATPASSESNIHGSGVDLEIEVFEGAGSYVAGEETALLHSMEGLRGAAAARPPFPAGRGGLYGIPTAVNNVETLSALPVDRRQRGGEAYAARGAAGRPGTKLVCLNERFARPGVYEVEFGTSIAEIYASGSGGVSRSGELAFAPGGRAARRVPRAPTSSRSPLDDRGACPARSLARPRQPGRVRRDHRGREPAAPPLAVRDRRELRRLLALPRRQPPRARARGSAGRWLAATPAKRLERLLDTMEHASLCGFGQGLPAAVRSLRRVYADELGPA